jgi:PAS domain S-box-containing protein
MKAAVGSASTGQPSITPLSWNRRTTQSFPKASTGVILTWNRGAQRLFGYTAEEAIGRPVTMLIPADRPDEEPMILDRVRRGQRIDHYETIRQRKDGGLIHISLTVSSIKDQEGNIVGASKIARDISDRRRIQQQQDLCSGRWIIESRTCSRSRLAS